MVHLGGQEAFLDADKIVGSLGVMPGYKVADLGCGSGYFTLALARVVGKNGIVTAVDVMQESLESVQSHTLGLGNVQVVRADLEVLGGTKIADGSQDLALMKNTLFQSKKQEAMIQEAVRITKPGGHVVIIDFKKGAGGLGPPDELRPDQDRIQQVAQTAGLRLDRQLPVDAFHFGMVFTK